MSKSLIITRGRDLIPPLHPGEVLKEEFMTPLGLSANAVAQAAHVPANRITAIINGTRNISADTALRLARLFGTSPEFWMNLQLRYDLDVASDASKGLDDLIRLRAL